MVKPCRPRPLPYARGGRIPWYPDFPTTTGRRGCPRRLDGARAGSAADARVALIVELVVRDVVFLDVVPDLLVRPVDQRVDLGHAAVARVDLDLGQVGPGRRLLAAQPGHPGVEIFKRPVERL